MKQQRNQRKQRKQHATIDATKLVNEMNKYFNQPFFEATGSIFQAEELGGVDTNIGYAVTFLTIKYPRTVELSFGDIADSVIFKVTAELLLIDQQGVDEEQVIAEAHKVTVEQAFEIANSSQLLHCREKALELAQVGAEPGQRRDGADHLDGNVHTEPHVVH